MYYLDVSSFATIQGNTSLRTRQVQTVTKIPEREADFSPFLWSGRGELSDDLFFCAADNGRVGGLFVTHPKAQEVPQLPELEEVAAA